MRLRARIADVLNARVASLMPAAAATIWDTSGVVVLIEQAKFFTAGGFTSGGFERLYGVDATLRCEVQTDDLAALDLDEELISSLINTPIYLAPQTVEVGHTTELGRVKLEEFRMIPREGRLVISLTLTAKAEVMRYHGPGVVPAQVLSLTPELEGVA